MATTTSFGDSNSGLQAGIINGPVNTQFHHHAPPERPETSPNPSIVIPFSRNTDFVERGILDQIHQKCAVLGSRIALVGLGGVGKSQLAIEIAYRTRDRSPETCVFWYDKIHLPQNFPRPRHPIVWSPNETSFHGIKCYEVPGTIDGFPVNALPDWGSALDAVSEDFAKRHGLRIKATETESIRLPGGHIAESVGRIVGNFKFQGEKRVYSRQFHVLRKSVYDLVLGRKFLEQTKTLTEFCHRIVERFRPCAQERGRLLLLDESPKERLRCTVNGTEASAFPDTGSELMLVSGDFVRRNKLKVYRGRKYRRQVELIDGSIIHTDGMALNAELQFEAPPTSQALDYDQYLGFTAGLSSLINHGAEMTAKETFICDLHVIEDLPCDIILSNEFIFKNQVFSKFKSLFYSMPVNASAGDVILHCGLLFMRNKSTMLSWFPRRRQLPQSETNTIPLQDGPSWEERWEIEEVRRNKAQLRIAPLQEPQKSVEQRAENHRQAVWDRDNPRPPPYFTPFDPSLRRTPTPRFPSPAIH